MDVHKNRCMTNPGATPFGLSSPPCDDEDDPTKVAKRNRLQSVHPHQTKPNSLAKYSGLWHKTTFFEKKKKTELFKKDFRISTVPGWNF